MEALGVLEPDNFPLPRNRPEIALPLKNCGRGLFIRLDFVSVRVSRAVAVSEVLASAGFDCRIEPFEQASSIEPGHQAATPDLKRARFLPGHPVPPEVGDGPHELRFRVLPRSRSRG